MSSRYHKTIQNILARKALDEKLAAGDAAGAEALVDQYLGYKQGQQKREEKRSSNINTAAVIGATALGMPVVGLGIAAGTKQNLWKRNITSVRHGIENITGKTAAKEAESSQEFADIQAAEDQAAAEEAIAAEALAAEEAEKKRIASKYGYAKTIRTTGQGVLGSAPVARKTLLGG